MVKDAATDVAVTAVLYNLYDTRKCKSVRCLIHKKQLGF